MTFNFHPRRSGGTAAVPQNPSGSQPGEGTNKYVISCCTIRRCKCRFQRGHYANSRDNKALSYGRFRNSNGSAPQLERGHHGSIGSSKTVHACAIKRGPETSGPTGSIYPLLCVCAHACVLAANARVHACVCDILRTFKRGERNDLSGERLDKRETWC